MNSKEAEEYVRARWIEAREVYPSPRDDSDIYIGGKYLFDTWLAAAEFTRQREQKIQNQQHRIEIVETARSVMIERGYFWGPVGDEIITSEKAQLAVLLVGWKEKP